MNSAHVTEFFITCLSHFNSPLQCSQLQNKRRAAMQTEGASNLGTYVSTIQFHLMLTISSSRSYSQYSPAAISPCVARLASYIPVSKWSCTQCVYLMKECQHGQFIARSAFRCLRLSFIKQLVKIWQAGWSQRTKTEFQVNIHFMKSSCVNNSVYNPFSAVVSHIS